MHPALRYMLVLTDHYQSGQWGLSARPVADAPQVFAYALAQMGHESEIQGRTLSVHGPDRKMHIVFQQALVFGQDPPLRVGLDGCVGEEALLSALHDEMARKTGAPAQMEHGEAGLVTGWRSVEATLARSREVGNAYCGWNGILTRETAQFGEEALALLRAASLQDGSPDPAARPRPRL